MRILSFLISITLTAVSFSSCQTAKLQGPACIIHGDRDGIVPLWCSEKYRTLYPAPEFHLVHGENHLIINRQRKVIRHIVDFLNKQ